VDRLQILAGSPPPARFPFRSAAPSWLPLPIGPFELLGERPASGEIQLPPGSPPGARSGQSKGPCQLGASPLLIIHLRRGSGCMAGPRPAWSSQHSPLQGRNASRIALWGCHLSCSIRPS